MDATYLSPHVNMSARLEAATTQFNRKMLVSDVFYKHMTPDASDLELAVFWGQIVRLSFRRLAPGPGGCGGAALGRGNGWVYWGSMEFVGICWNFEVSQNHLFPYYCTVPRFSL